MKRFWIIMSCSIIFYFAGISLPILRLEKIFGIFSNEQSILSGLALLFNKQEYFIFGIITVFSVMFPILKLISMVIIAKNHGLNRAISSSWIKRLEEAGKWSMLDVFVVSLLVVFVKLGSLANVTPRIGIIFFALSVIFTSVALNILKKNLNHGSQANLL